MLIHRYKPLARFGLMHMIATNMSVWLENVVKETLRRLGKLESIDALSQNSTGYSLSYLVQGECFLIQTFLLRKHFTCTKY